MQKIRDWLFLTKDDKYVYFQFPNWPLMAVVAMWLMSKGIDAQPYNNLLVLLYRVTLLFWASLEIKEGVNHFRMILGTVVFVIVLLGFSNQLL